MPDLEVEVRAGCQAGRADSRNDLSLLHRLPLADQQGRTVAVERGDPAAVINDDAVTVSTGVGGQNHRARGRRMDGCA